MKIQQKITFSGPFFSKDVGKTLRENLRTMLDRMAQEGERAVRSELQAGQGGRSPISHGVMPDRVSEHAIGRVNALSGRRWALTAVISINNKGFSREQGISLMAAASGVERQTRAFRRVASALRSSRAVAQADIAKGLE